MLESGAVRSEEDLLVVPADLRRQFDLALRLTAMLRETSRRKLARLNREATRLFEIIEGCDRAPTTQAVASVADLEQRVKATPSSAEAERAQNRAQ